VECGLCIEKCPFKLPIPEILQRADKALSGEQP
jgi:predicted aldo/keto reductase-like oxidoreductase